MRVLSRIALVALVLSRASVLGGQPAAEEVDAIRVTGTVQDPSGAVMPGVDVKVLWGTLLVSRSTDNEGSFSFELPPGEYQMAVAAPEFKTWTETIRVTPSMPALKISLFLADVSRTVEVLADSNERDADPGVHWSSITISGAELMDLPEDEESLSDYLQLLAGGTGSAQIIVDGFSSSRFPPRSQIGRIVVEQSPFNADGVGPRISVTSREPGPIRWAGRLHFGLQGRSFSAAYDGPIVRGKLSMGFNASIQRGDSERRSIRALLPDGPVDTSFMTSSGSRTFGMSGTLRPSPSHSINFRFNQSEWERLNDGAGGFILEERGFDNASRSWSSQISGQTILSPRMIHEFRFQFNRTRSRAIPRTEAVAIDVLGAFSGGGAQVRADFRSSSYSGGSTLRWAPSPKWNVQIASDANYESSRNVSGNNYLGTFTFSSLEDYVAKRPLLFSKVANGDPVTETKRLGFSSSFQADYRMTLKTALRIGARYSFGSTLRDYDNVDPVTQLSYQLKKGSVIRLSAAISHSAASPVIDAREPSHIVIVNPSYPDPFSGSSVGAATTLRSSSIRVRARDFVSAYTMTSQLSLQQTLRKDWRLTASFAVNRSVHQPRMRNINAPYPGSPLPSTMTPAEIDRLRPRYPFTGAIHQYESTGNALSKGFDVILQAAPVRAFLKSVVSGTAQYHLNWSEDDNEGSNPYDRRSAWARTGQRHTLTSIFSIRSSVLGSFSFPIAWNSGRAYSVTTGRDDNFDQSMNDRPEGVKRNSLRAPGAFNVNLSYTSPPIARFPLRLTVQVSDLLNRAQISGLNSVITSPLFGKPSSYGPGRSIRISTSLASF